MALPQCQDERGTQEETTRRIHESDEVEVTIRTSGDGCIVQLEGDPSFVDMKLVWMEHGGDHL